MTIAEGSQVRLKHWVRLSMSLVFAAAFAVVAVHVISFSHADSGPAAVTATATPSSTFNYGFDFDGSMTTSPIAKAPNVQDAVTSALGVMSHFGGSMMAQSIYGSGAANPEPNVVPTATPLDSSNTNLASIASRISLITTAGGTPVLNFIAAPNWMVGCTNYAVGACPGGDTSPSCVEDPNTQPLVGSPPCPAHFQDYAKLCAYIAAQFPQVKYFVVWSEMRGFYNSQTQVNDDPSYTQMYNDIYTAVKQVRPDALIGGPYANLYSTPCNQPPNYPAACPAGSLSGSWGYTKVYIQQSLQYWLAHKVGADFVVIDGSTEIASKCTNSISTGYSCGAGDNLSVDPITSSQKFAAVDTWIRSQTSLPIWWLESHIQPDPSSPQAWTNAQAAAARVATLAIMNASGASVGMQWNPMSIPTWADMGLWTSTTSSVASGGGLPTPLGTLLPGVLPLLRQPLTIVGGQPTGVLVARAGNQVLLVNTNNANATATINKIAVNLGPGAVVDEPIPQPAVTGGGATTTGSAASGTTSSTSTSGVAATASPVIPVSSAQDPITSAVVTLGPPPTDLGKIASVSYSIDNKLVAKTTKAPFTYNLKTDSLTNGCHQLATTTTLLDGSSKTTTQQLCVKNTASIWYAANWVKATGIGILLWILGTVAWICFGLPHIARGARRLPGGHHLVHVIEPKLVYPGQ